jgi:anti-sigma-K factor RskA
MEVEKYIASGILELYVAGALTPEENLEVHRYAEEYPEIKMEIEAIEATIMELARTTSPGLPKDGFKRIGAKLDDVITFVPPTSKKKAPWGSYLGWAASLLFAAGLLWVYTENNNLKSEIEVSNQEKQDLEETLSNIKEEAARQETFLEMLRGQNVTVIALGGQAVSPESYAKAYWDRAENKVVIDAQGLPEPPTGFTYQVWSLKLDPLTPTSIGLLDDFISTESKLFTLENANESEAFGITLEPEGGSESPTLEQLYTLGAIGR